MNVAVIIPTGGDDPHRLRALSLVGELYASAFPAWTTVLVAGCKTNKGVALNAAVDELDDDVDLLLLNDGDSLCAPYQITKAVGMADAHPGLVFGYTRYRRLDRETSELLRSPWDALASRDDQVEWEKLESGSHGCIAIQRSCWLQVGGLDPAFGMAGYEDLAFDVVCEAHWPSRRVGGDLFHLWHPRGWDADPAREAANLARYRDSYVANWGDKEKLLAVRHG